MRTLSFCCYIMLYSTTITLLAWSMPTDNFSCQNPLLEDNLPCSKSKLEELKENLRNSSRIHIEEEAPVSQQIDQITASLEKLEKEQKGECAKITWMNIIMHTLFGKNHLCI